LLSWPCWLTDSGRLNRKVVTHPGSSLLQDRESSPAETSVLTTMLRRQLRRSTGTSVIKEISLKILSPRVPPFKVTQGHRNRHTSICHLCLPINVP